MLGTAFRTTPVSTLSQSCEGRCFLSGMSGMSSVGVVRGQTLRLSGAKLEVFRGQTLRFSGVGHRGCQWSDITVL